MYKIPEKLKNKWGRKLLDSGFHDIENKDGSLKAEADPRTIANALKREESTKEYYSQAREFLNRYEFPNRKEYGIWEGHCNGLSFRTMAELLSLTFYRVRMIVIMYQKLAGLYAKR